MMEQRNTHRLFVFRSLSLCMCFNRFSVFFFLLFLVTWMSSKWTKRRRKIEKIHEAENSPSAYTNPFVVIVTARASLRGDRHEQAKQKVANWNRFRPQLTLLYFIWASGFFWPSSSSFLGCRDWSSISQHLSRMRQLLKLMAELQESLWCGAEKTENLDFVERRKSGAVAAEDTA